MKATEQYFPVELFITLYKVVLTFLILIVLVSLEMKTIKHKIPVILNKKVRCFESVNEIRNRELLNESY